MYLAHAESDARIPKNRNVEVALKVPRGDTITSVSEASSLTRREKIILEASFLREVAHQSIIKLIDIRASTPGKENDQCDLPTLVFPPAELDLSSFLNRMPEGQGLPNPLARRWMAQLASAVAHVHSHGILHRDIKPPNCLIFMAASELHGELLGSCLRLADFGMARRMTTRTFSSHSAAQPGRTRQTVPADI